MRHSIYGAATVALALLPACNNPVTVVAMQPKLANAGLHGGRICGNFSTTFQQFSFTCPALPTVEASGWQLTPEEMQTPKPHPNNGLDLTITGPSLSSLDVEFAYTTQRPNSPVTQIDPQQRPPGEVALAKEVGVTMTDDGTTRTWIVQVTVSTCAEFRQLQFFNRGTSGPRSNPLVVFLIRSPQELYCASNQAPLPDLAGGPGPGDPVNAHPAGTCAGGAVAQTFNVCENCAVTHPPSMNVFTTYTACSWNDVLNAFGYQPGSTKAQSCTIQQANRQSCQGF